MPKAKGMKLIVVEGIDEDFISKVGNLPLFVPPGKNPDEEIIYIPVDKTECGVPITTLRISPRQWMKFYEHVFLSLVREGKWPEEYARQLLPGGR